MKQAMKRGVLYPEKFAPFVDHQKSKVIGQVEHAQKCLDSSMSNYRMAFHRYNQAIRDLKYYREQIPGHKKTLREVTKTARNYKTDNVRITREWERLKSHPAINKLNITPQGNLTFVLWPLFTDIRLNGDTRDTQRAFLGVFQITIKTDSQRIWVKNLTFNSDRPHWSVGGGYACQGDWSNLFEDARERGNWSLFVTTLVQYLKSTDDGSAYRRAHQWRDSNRYITINSGPYSEKYRRYTGYFYTDGDTSTERVDIREAVGLNSNYSSEVSLIGHTESINMHDWYSDGVPTVLDTKLDACTTQEEAVAICEAYRARHCREYCHKLLDDMTDETAYQHIDQFKQVLDLHKLLDLLDPITE